MHCPRLCCVPVQAAVGGRLRAFISGGAPLPTYAQDFMQIAMCTPVLQVSRHDDRQALPAKVEQLVLQVLQLQLCFR